jgi:hypothetical protein
MYFEKNLRALSKGDPALARRLSDAREIPPERPYTFPLSRDGKLVPALAGPGATERALHSLFSPHKEAVRLIATRKDEGFIIFLGLGGGFYAAAALETEEKPAQQFLIIDFDAPSIAELFTRIDYTGIINDSRVHFLIDPSGTEIVRFILDHYQPVLMNGLRAFPLRARVEADPAAFSRAERAISEAIKRVSADFSVQSHFGLRWFSNIVRNLDRIEAYRNPMIGKIEKTAVIAAGPSLDSQLPLIEEIRGKTFIIATDTSLPALLHAGIEADAVISIDCQLWSYNHFMQGLPATIPLYLDIASPPSVAACSPHPRFFSSGHPLAAYLSQTWMPLPALDTSGGNVTYAAISLAESLGARSTLLFGADFAYPSGLTYARGTWLYPFYEKQHTRFSPSETLFSTLLFRTPLHKRIRPDGAWYYETPALVSYRTALEEASLRTTLQPAAGFGAPLAIQSAALPTLPTLPPFIAGPPRASQFLTAYRERIARLSFPAPATTADHPIFTTLLPTAAAIKYRNPGMNHETLFEATRNHCLNVLAGQLGRACYR